MKRLLGGSFSHMASLNFTVILLAMFLLIVLIDTAEDAIISLARNLQLPGSMAIDRLLTGYFSNEVHASPWFKTLLVLFIINLLTCMAKRIPGTVRMLFPEASEAAHTMPAAPQFEDAFTVTGLQPDFEYRLYGLLEHQFSRPAVNRSGVRSVFFAQRGKCFHCGFYLAHGGLLIALAGGLLVQSSFSGEMFLREGDTDDRVFFKEKGKSCFRKLDCAVRLDKYEPAEAAQDGRGTAHKAFRTTITLLHEGTNDKKGVLEGYRTFADNGIRIAQSRSPEVESPHVMLSVLARTAGARRRTFFLKRYQCFQVPETGHTIRLKDVLTRDHPGGSDKKDAPAIPTDGTATLEVYGTDSSLLYKALVTSHPVAIEQPWQDEYEFLITGVGSTDPSPACTRLVVSTEPGSGLIGSGAAVAIAGFSLIFFLTHRKIWVAIEKRSGDCFIKVAGWSSRNPDALADCACRIKQLALQYPFPEHTS